MLHLFHIEENETCEEAHGWYDGAEEHSDPETY